MKKERQKTVRQNQFEKIGIDSLQKAFHVFNQLGETGKELMVKKHGIDMALRMDIEAEEAVIEVLTKSGLPLELYSEEHGVLGTHIWRVC